MSATQPGTVAGRALLDDGHFWRCPFANKVLSAHADKTSASDCTCNGRILAIETEAAAAERERIRAALLGPDAHADALYERHTRAILDAAAGSDR